MPNRNTQRSRAADAAIRGYHYQLDKALLETLALPPSGSLAIEGIEDVDVSTPQAVRLVQCKYLQAQTFSLSKVKPALLQMFKHFCKEKKKHTYHLYAHFSDSEIGTVRLSTADLTACLKGKKGRLSTPQRKKIKPFISRLKFEIGPTIEAQRNEIFGCLKSEFGSDDVAAQELYYPKALDFTLRIATHRAIRDRTIKKADLLAALSNDHLIFGSLFAKFKGEKEFIKLLRQELVSSKRLSDSASKFLLLDCETAYTGSVEETSALIKSLTTKYFSIGHSLYDAKPWTICLNCDQIFLNRLKKKLIAQEIIFNDGFESIEFSSSIYNRDPLIARSNNGKGTKIGSASFQLRLISYATALANWTSVKKPDLAICISKNYSSDPILEGIGQSYHLRFKSKPSQIEALLIGG